MGQIIIHDIDDELLVRLKRRAWHQGLPFETSLRNLLVESVESEEFELVTMPYPSHFIAEKERATFRVFHA